MIKCLLVHLIIWVIEKRDLSESEKRNSSSAEPEAV